MKSLLIASLMLSVAPLFAEDGFHTGNATVPGTGQIIGKLTTLTVEGKQVYTRLTFAGQKGPGPEGADVVESFLVDGVAILKLFHFSTHTGCLFTSHKDYRVTAMITGGDASSREIKITSMSDFRTEHVWKPDEDGYYTDYHRRGLNPPTLLDMDKVQP